MYYSGVHVHVWCIVYELEEGSKVHVLRSYVVNVEENILELLWNTQDHQVVHVHPSHLSFKNMYMYIHV